MFKLRCVLSHAGLATAISLLAPALAHGQDEPLPLEPSLKSVPAPIPTTLFEYVADRDAAIRLGKALFWDVRLGSDGVTACATCHHHAGADPRVGGIFHPGANGTFGSSSSVGGRASASTFPLTKFANPNNRFSQLQRSSDDVIGSPGTFREQFMSLTGDGDELCADLPETVFTSNGERFRQVTGRNAPSVINAIYNVRQFWDGRANAWFNGVNPFGPVDESARVWRVDPKSGQPTQVQISIDHASLASQAVGPVNNGVEMAAHGRGWIDVARKLLPTHALASQKVSSTDSVLGAFAAPGNGLTLRYDDMFRAAFNAQWRADVEVQPGVTMLEANMPLMFGLALQLYQGTLVSDDSRYDQWIERNGPNGGAPGLLSDQELRGLRLFFNLDPTLPPTNCRACHVTSLFTVATYAGKFGGGGGGNGGGNFPGAVDSDGDTYPDIIDAFPLDPAEWIDTDEDGIGNNADPDDDNDGLPDAVDPFPLDPHNAAEPPPDAGAEFAPQPIAFMTGMDGLLRRTMMWEEAPYGFEPSVKPMDFSLTGDGIRVYDPAGKLAVHVPMIPRESFPCHFTYAPEVPVPHLGSTAALQVEARTRNCRLSLKVALFNFPLGAYRLTIDGVDRGYLYSEPLIMYDEGFYNLGVRPTAEDLGVGGSHPNGIPLAAARRLYLNSFLPEFGQLWNGGNLQTRVDGSFKTPSLRNVELTGPYFHNGGVASLEGVIRFYNRGGDFHEANQSELAPTMLAMDLSDTDVSDLAAFLRTLTDERVRDERAPFDHPSMPLPSGGQVPAIGQSGRTANCATPLRTFSENLALADPWIGDCDRNGLIDTCEIERNGPVVDVNGNGLIDSCEPPCAADVTGDRAVTGDDLTTVLAAWMAKGAAAGAADIDGSGLVDGGDLAILLGSWGACP